MYLEIHSCFWESLFRFTHITFGFGRHWKRERYQSVSSDTCKATFLALRYIAEQLPGSSVVWPWLVLAWRTELPPSSFLICCLLPPSLCHSISLSSSACAVSVFAGLVLPLLVSLLAFLIISWQFLLLSSSKSCHCQQILHPVYSFVVLFSCLAFNYWLQLWFLHLVCLLYPSFPHSSHWCTRPCDFQVWYFLATDPWFACPQCLSTDSGMTACLRTDGVPHFLFCLTRAIDGLGFSGAVALL